MGTMWVVGGSDPYEMGWAAWGVIVGAVAAAISFIAVIAVWWLGRKTNLLAQAANRVADESHSARVEADARRAQSLLLYLSLEARSFRREVKKLVGWSALDVFADRYRDDSDFRTRVNDGIASLALPRVKEKFDDLWQIPNPTSALLAGSVGLVDSLQDAVPAFDGDADRESLEQFGALVSVSLRRLLKDYEAINAAVDMTAAAARMGPPK